MENEPNFSWLHDNLLPFIGGRCCQAMVLVISVLAHPTNLDGNRARV